MRMWTILGFGGGRESESRERDTSKATTHENLEGGKSTSRRTSFSPLQLLAQWLERGEIGKPERPASSFAFRFPLFFLPRLIILAGVFVLCAVSEGEERKKPLALGGAAAEHRKKRLERILCFSFLPAPWKGTGSMGLGLGSSVVLRAGGA